MDFELTPEQQEVRALARDFAEREVAPVIRHFDEAPGVPPRDHGQARPGPGSWARWCPRSTAGPALDYVSYALAVEELNRVDASVGITMWAHNSLCTNHIALFGSPEQKAALPAAAGPRRGAGRVGAHRARARAPTRRRCRRGRSADGDHFVLNGSKAFITNAGVAEVAVVMAVTDPARGNKGISAFILEQGHCPGFSAGKPVPEARAARLQHRRARSSTTCACPRPHLCGERDMGFVNTMQVLEGGRIAMAAMAVGIAQGALDEALKYMKQRSAFGRTLAEFNGLQGMIADIGTEVEAARLLTLRAAVAQGRRPPGEGRGLDGQGLRLRGGHEGGDQGRCRSTGAPATSRSSRSSGSSATPS